MEFQAVLLRRRMVRNYLDEPVPHEVIERILRAARRAPTAGFAQGQSFVVVTDLGLRRRIADIAGEHRYTGRGHPPWISRAPVLVVLCTSRGAYEERYRLPDKAGPGAVLDWPVPYWYVDAGCSMMLLLLATADEGLAAGFLGAHRLPGLRGLLGIPGDVEPIGLITIGRAAPDRRSESLRLGWRPEDEVVHWQGWGTRRPNP